MTLFLRNLVYLHILWHSKNAVCNGIGHGRGEVYQQQVMFSLLVLLLILIVYCPRSSRQSPSVPQGSISTSYRGPTNKAQLLNKMPNFSEMKKEDEELNYKVWADSICIDSIDIIR